MIIKGIRVDKLEEKSGAKAQWFVKLGGVQKRENKADLAAVLERRPYMPGPWQVSRNLDLGRTPSSLTDKSG